MESKLKTHEADLKLKILVKSERKITIISEIDRRRLFLDLGYSSLFSYLTEEIGYSPSAAQRRIEAARLSRQVPGISEKLKSGTLNLSSLTLACQAIREKSKTFNVTSEVKYDLINKIENKNTKEAQIVLAQSLNLPAINFEKTKYQKDESIIIELTLSKSQNEKLQKARELASHIKTQANWSEFIEHLADFYLSKKQGVAQNQKSVSKSTSEAEVKTAGASNQAAPSRYVSQRLRRIILERDHSCRWKAKNSGKICGSKNQLEVHHKKPVWAGGISNQDNLQILCKNHNSHVYRSEAQIKFL